MGSINKKYDGEEDMKLNKQLAILSVIFFIILFFTILVVSINIIKDSVQKELYENAQNSVSSLSISISNTSTSLNNIKTMIDATFDNGNYERITYKDINNNILYQRDLELRQNHIPLWFENLIEIKIPVAKSTLSNNWQIIGIVEILNDKNTAYSQLYDLMINMFLYLRISYVIFIFILNYIFHLLLKPLLYIEKQAVCAIKNEFIIQKKLPKTKEFRVVIKSINSMIKKFESIFITANETLSQNKQLLYIDKVTNISNRRYFILKASEYINNENERNTGTIIILSVKNADLFNKKMGYKNTDNFIYELAQYVKSLTKIIDAVLVCRLNGTEIVLMLPKIDIKKSSTFAKNIISYVDYKLDELTLSKNDFGIYLAILEYKNLQNISDLLGLIDYSLSQAKLLSSGEFYTYINSNITIGKDTWRENILDALQNDHFEIIYRKVIDIESKQQIHNVVTFNLNIKNQSYSYGTLIAPVVNLGMIENVYLHIIKKVLISNASIEDNFTAIQLSSLFLNNLNSYEKLKLLFENTKMQNKCKIVFEIPESIINEHYQNSLLYINLFKEYGFDFGINNFIADSKDYSYFKELKPVFIKADKQYLIDTQQDINILKIIMESLNLQLIATGVNDIDELNILYERGIKSISGKIVDKIIKINY
jgi:diguanylate cyclase (GGDEF)-like protein